MLTLYDYFLSTVYVYVTNLCLHVDAFHLTTFFYWTTMKISVFYFLRHPYIINLHYMLYIYIYIYIYIYVFVNYFTK